jgi:8-amino-7-oxononanoate synthase
LENKIKEHLNSKNTRMIIAIEGVYSMSATIAPKEFAILATKYNAILLVDEAHSSGVIGKNLLGWYDYWDIKIEPNYIKMGTLGKAYGSFGAYILASSHIVSYLENRAKSIIYTTSLSLFDTSLAFENLKYIQKNKNKIKNKIKSYQKIVNDILGIKVDSLIVPIEINDNKKVLIIQKELQSLGYLVGAIRQPTVKKAIIRMIIKLDITKKQLVDICQIIKNRI